MKAIKLMFILSIIFCVISCQPKELNPAEYTEWVKDYSHGLHKMKTVGDIVFDLQCKPVEFIVVNEQKGNIPDKELLDTRVNELSKNQYYTLSLKVKDKTVDFLKYKVTSEKEFYEKLYYYSFAFQNDIFLEDGGKMLPCKLFHFERSYDLKKSRTFELSFPAAENSTSDKTIVINSKDLNCGPVRIKINQDDLNSTPRIKI
ncbi:MAG TPA: hypothetical protein VNW99_03920 [Cytophagaceae bacterium]|jgi:hypothetical protein|nr:hypothetical protein [Cytophagaceae bacterium]